MNRYSDWFNVGPLGVGRTTAIAVACKAIGAKMICANERHAKQVKQEHGIDTVSIESSGVGLRGPFLADHYAIQSITHQYEVHIDRKNKEINKLNARLDKQARVMDGIKRDKDAYKKYYFELTHKIEELEQKLSGGEEAG